MTQTILLAYSTTDGHTLTICRRLQDRLAARGYEVTLSPITQVDDAQADSADKIVIGASIRYGKHAAAVTDFIATRQNLLESRPSAFFSVNLVARKSDKNQPGSNPYVRKFLAKLPWKPKLSVVFAGRLDYPRYSYWDRQVIRLIMWITGGPTDPSTVVEYTDWAQVDAFAEQICTL